MALTPEERIAHQREARRRYNEKMKQNKLNNNDVGVANTATTIQSLVEENNLLKRQVEELQSICKNYAVQAESANKALSKATIDYNARTEYILDCIKHTYLSAQFAVNAANKKGDNND